MLLVKKLLEPRCNSISDAVEQSSQQPADGCSSNCNVSLSEVQYCDRAARMTHRLRRQQTHSLTLTYTGQLVFTLLINVHNDYGNAFPLLPYLTTIL